MTEGTVPDPLLVRYLLGELSPDDEAALDERAFVDDSWDEARAVAVDDLIDAYLGRELTADQSARFETHFLASSAHRERFRLIQDLRTVVAQRRASAPDVRPPWRRPGIVWAAAAALIAVLAAILVATMAPRHEAPRIASGPTPSPPATPTPSPSPLPATGTARVSLPVQPGRVHIAVDSTVRTVRLSVPVPVSAPGRTTYIAVVEQAGRSVWEMGDLEAPAGADALVVDVPAAVLRDQAVDFVMEPEATRSQSPHPQARRVWRLQPRRP